MSGNGRNKASKRCIDPFVERQKWIMFAGKLLTLCVEILGASDVPITENEFAEPKILALVLLSRTHLNLKGVIAVAEKGLVVEARTLTRSCFENLFFVSNLIVGRPRRLDPFGTELANQLRDRLPQIGPGSECFCDRGRTLP
jgi:hypothetical protein